MKTFIKKNSLLLIMLCSISIGANAQKTKSSKSKQWHNHDFAGSMDIQLGYRKTDMGPLNQYLNQRGFSSLANHNIWYNLSSSRIYCNKVITNLAVGFTPTSSATGNNNTKATYHHGQIIINAGYNLSTNTAFRLYPLVGINLSDAMLKIKDSGNINNTNDFGQEITNTSSSKTLNQYTFAVELGGGFDYLIKMKSKQFDCYTIERNVPIGIRAGYYIPTHVTDWKVDDHTLQNGPNKKTNSFFVTLSLGLGFSKKKS